MTYYTKVMSKLRKKECKHSKSEESNMAICEECYLLSIKEEVNTWRNKTYIIKNEIK